MTTKIPIVVDQDDANRVPLIPAYTSTSDGMLSDTRAITICAR
jgi:hypothetical protein